jgi:predicted permease
MAGFRRIANLFRRGRVDREIEAELRAHLEMRIEDNIAEGMTPAEARRAARLRFGNPSVMRERATAEDASLGLEGVWRDVRYAARQLRRSPGYALTAVLTLALGIGANVVVFGVLYTLLLRPLDVSGADRLYQVEQRNEGNLSQSYPDYVDFRARNSTFSDLAMFRISAVALGTGGPAQWAWEYEVSGNYFDMLGVQPALGRLIHGSDERGENSAAYIVLSDGFWRRRFNADPSVVGRTVELNKHPFTIVGVAPHTFQGTELFLWPDFWMPLVNEEQVEGYRFLTKRSMHGSFVIGMLKPGVTVQQGTENLLGVAKQLAREYPVDDDGLGVHLAKPGLMGDTLGGPARPFLAAMMGLALLVLAAACVNLAGIFAARAADRTRELAICLSIGATRGRMLRRVLIEAGLVSVLGGIAGTVLAVSLLGTLSRWQPIAGLPIHVAMVPDAGVFALALGLTLASGILPGLLPARQIWRTDAMVAMKSGAAAPGRLPALARRLTLRDVLLGAQITICALLVTASLVSLRGLERSLQAPLGFVPQGALVATTDMHMGGYADDAEAPVQRRMIEEASRIPGVTAVGTIDDVPLGSGGSSMPVYQEGTTDLRPSNEVMGAHFYSISPGYLEAAGTRLLAGGTSPGRTGLRRRRWPW